jgi:hypothetical protein
MKKLLIATILAAMLAVPVFAGVEIGMRLVDTEILVPQITISLDESFLPSVTAFKFDVYDGLTFDGTYSLSATWDAPFLVYDSPNFGIAVSFYFGAGAIVIVESPAFAVVDGYATLGAKVDCGQSGALFAELMIFQDGSYVSNIGGTLVLPSLTLPAFPAGE